MTVIVWDGRTLAVDSAALQGNVVHRADKVVLINGNRELLTGHGDAALVLQLVDWYKAGADVATFPFTSGFSHNPAELIVLRRDGLYRYEGPHPIYHGQNACAFGDGADFAYGALYVTMFSAKAVAAACEYSPSCAGPVHVYYYKHGRISKEVYDNGDFAEDTI